VVYQDRPETNLLQLCAHLENSEWFLSCYFWDQHWWRIEKNI